MVVHAQELGYLYGFRTFPFAVRILAFTRNSFAALADAETFRVCC